MGCPESKLESESARSFEGPNTTPLDWPIWCILKVFTGTDGLVRVVEVKTSSGILRRVINKVISMSIPDDSAAVDQS
ncbi:hypothetical protein TNCT_324311 [Trichonephila clavata]|uniref:DUF5641 domain-containing protein n=1 Tax=Trichonephila clavata TaxID=2740835 RepID=A0A8X6GDE2_TRICU|nr:hypothetical protein TNCT_324311 [Trichonephila clavata]